MLEEQLENQQIAARVVEFLRDSDELRLYFLWGGPRSVEIANCEIEAERLLSLAGDRTKIVDGLEQSLRENAEIMRCFVPHHGVLARRGTEQLELLLCLKCTTMRVYFVGENSFEAIPMSESVLPILDEFLPPYYETVGKRRALEMAEWETFLAPRLAKAKTPDDAREIRSQAAREFFGFR